MEAKLEERVKIMRTRLWQMANNTLVWVREHVELLWRRMTSYNLVDIGSVICMLRVAPNHYLNEYLLIAFTKYAFQSCLLAKYQIFLSRIFLVKRSVSAVIIDHYHTRPVYYQLRVKFLLRIQRMYGTKSYVVLYENIEQFWLHLFWCVNAASL